MRSPSAQAVRAPARQCSYPSGLLQTQSDSGARPALRPIRRTSAWAEDRHKCLAGLTAHRAIGLDRPDVHGCSFALFSFVTLLTGRALRSLGALSTGRTLNTCDTLNALRTLRTSRSLWSRVTLRPGVSATGGKRKRETNGQQRQQLHDSPLKVIHSDGAQCTEGSPVPRRTTVTQVVVRSAGLSTYLVVTRARAPRPA